MARCDFASDFGRSLVQLERLVGEVVFVEHERKGAERRRFHPVTAGGEELVVHPCDQVGPGQDEVFVAAFERLAAEIVGSEILGLHEGAECAVEDEHPLPQRIEERRFGATADGRVSSTADRSSHQAMRSAFRFGIRFCQAGSVDCAVRRLGRVKVYTRTGDDGTTGLFYGGRAGKDDVGPAAYGDVDEAVSALGFARAEVEPGDEFHDLLVQLQRELFVVGAELATAPGNRAKLKPGATSVTTAMVTRLEPIIDDITTRFDPPKEFVLPGENRTRRGARPRARDRAPRRAHIGRGDARGLARRREPGRAVSQPAGGPRLHAGSLARGSRSPAMREPAHVS